MLRWGDVLRIVWPKGRATKNPLIWNLASDLEKQLSDPTVSHFAETSKTSTCLKSYQNLLLIIKIKIAKMSCIMANGFICSIAKIPVLRWVLSAILYIVRELMGISSF